MKNRVHYLQENLPLVLHLLGVLILFPLQMRIISCAAGQLRLAAMELLFYRVFFTALGVVFLGHIFLALKRAFHRKDDMDDTEEDAEQDVETILNIAAQRRSLEPGIKKCLEFSGSSFKWPDNKSTTIISLSDTYSLRSKGDGKIIFDASGQVAYIEMLETGYRYCNEDYLKYQIDKWDAMSDAMADFLTRIIPDAEWRWNPEETGDITITSIDKRYLNCFATVKFAEDGHVTSIQVTDNAGKVHTHCNRAEKSVTVKAPAKATEKAKGKAVAEPVVAASAKADVNPVAASSPVKPEKKVVLRPDNVLPKAPVQTGEDYGTMDSSGVPDFPRESAASELIDNHAVEIEMAAENAAMESTDEVPFIEFPAYVGLQDQRDCEIFCQMLLASKDSPFLKDGYQITSKPDQSGHERLYIKLFINRAAVSASV